MKHLVLMICLVVGIITLQSQPVLANADIGSIEMMQDDGDQAIVQDAVEAEAPAEKKDEGWWSQITNVVLFVVTSVFAGLWAKVRLKARDIGELFLKAHEYTDDNKLDEEERKDLMARFYKIIGKNPQLE